MAREPREAAVGIDLGTTMSKALLRTPSGEQLALVEARKHRGPPRRTAAPSPVPSGLSSSSPSTCCAAATSAAAGGGPLRVSSIAVAGLAESGVVLDGSGRPLDSRRRMVPTVAALSRSTRFHCVTTTSGPNSCAIRAAVGLPGQRREVAVVRRRRPGALSPAHRWLSMPEYVVYRLGGELVHEPSLASRTGLLDQSTGRPWANGAAELGLPPTLLPSVNHSVKASGRWRTPDYLTGCGAPRSSSAATTIR